MKRERAYVDGRRRKILEILLENPSTRVEELAEQLHVSVVTIRRDLQYLENEKQVRRFYGGATVSKQLREQDGTAGYKQQIAKRAALLVEDGDTIFMNTSSTALMMLRFIQSKNVTVITNNGRAIYEEKAAGVNVILTGGELRYPKEAMVGDFALNNLQNVYAKKAFLGCSGLSVQSGVTTENANEVNVNHLMIEHAPGEVYILAGHEKIGKGSGFMSSTLGEIRRLVTDELAPAEELAQMRSIGVEIEQVKGF
ncbi:MAG: DeoR/GlpR family DNA-binding transcription regulator [Eubacteriales bacterium]|nr:DeoR/GlpR family DNA-binding transcription regulator [Eubacteriales bacterium]